MCRLMEMHLKKIMVKRINRNLMHTKISMNKDIKNEEKELYMENQEMFQQN